MTIGLTLPIVALGGASVKAAADMEAMQQQLSTMLQSDIKGAEMFARIKKMAAQTPFGTQDLMQATNTMLGFGIAQEKVLPLMQQLGDISGGNKDRFQSLALAFSQVSAAGKLQGQDLLQMINAGFNPLEAISKRTGKSIGQLKDEMSKGAISVEMVEQAMKDATSQGGRFFNMMQKQSKTALGQWSTMQDNLNQALADFGVQIMPYAIKALQSFSKLLEWFGNLSPATKKTIVVLAGFLAILGPIISTIGTLITTIASLSTGLSLLATVSGTTATALLASSAAFLGWVAVFAGIAAGIWAVIKAIQVLIDWIKHLNRMKINNLATDNLSPEALDKLRAKRKQMGAKKFDAAYPDIARQIKEADKNRGNSRITQTQNNTSRSNSVVNNYNYGNPQRNAIGGMLNPAYAMSI
jgi:tape measure domain-containing protein